MRRDGREKGNKREKRKMSVNTGWQKWRAGEKIKARFSHPGDNKRACGGEAPQYHFTPEPSFPLQRRDER